MVATNFLQEKTISNSMISLLYQQTHEKVQGYMNNSFAVCLTTDG